MLSLPSWETPRERETPTCLPKEHKMNHEQFGQFWEQLKAPLKAKWDKITEEDLAEIRGGLDRFELVLQKRYGEHQKDEVSTWANRRYSHWTGNYVGYKDPEPAL
jgi:uncharacterized protein YjbJ (UPF0337 family)